MSRAGIPSNKKNQFIKAKKQVCIYSFPRKAIIEFGQRKMKLNLKILKTLRF